MNTVESWPKETEVPDVCAERGKEVKKEIRIVIEKECFIDCMRKCSIEIVSSSHKHTPMLHSAEGGTRTPTRFESNWILSPARLPVPPLRHIDIKKIF